MNKLYEENHIQDIANAIRNKNVSGTFTVAQMAPAINNIQTGGTVEYSCMLADVITPPPKNISTTIGTSFALRNNCFLLANIRINQELTAFSFPNRAVLLTDNEDHQILSKILPNSLTNIHNLFEGFPKRSMIPSAAFDNGTTYKGYAIDPWCGPNVVDMSYAFADVHMTGNAPVVGNKVENAYLAYNNYQNYYGQPIVGPNIKDMYGMYKNCLGLSGSQIVMVSGNNAVTGIYEIYEYYGSGTFNGNGLADLRTTSGYVSIGLNSTGYSCLSLVNNQMSGAWLRTNGNIWVKNSERHYLFGLSGGTSGTVSRDCDNHMMNFIFSNKTLYDRVCNGDYPNWFCGSIRNQQHVINASDVGTEESVDMYINLAIPSNSGYPYTDEANNIHVLRRSYISKINTYLYCEE